MMMPNFLVIGAAKCGTDSLNSYLDQHPDIFMSPNKEPMFFVAEGVPEIPFCGPGDRYAIERWNCWVNTLEEYQSLFEALQSEKAIGEASTWYLYKDRARERIAHYVPDVRLIAILRNPVDRAYSAYNMLQGDGRESIADFDLALDAEDERVGKSWEPMWHYRRVGFYGAQLGRYYETFNREQIHVVLYDDFVARPVEVMQSIFRFLQVDDRFVPDVSERHNVSLVPKNPTYHNLVAGGHPAKRMLKRVLPATVRQRAKAKLLSGTLRRPTPLAPETRRRLLEVFRPDVMQLQDLLGRDLSTWLTAEQ
jgi:hypothetical protein